MNSAEVENIAAECLAALDDSVIAALANVTISVLPKPEMQGMFEGTVSQPSTDDEDSSVEPPSGDIILFASNLNTPREVQTVLYHEIGHALGLDEDDVAELELDNANGE